MWKIDDKIFLGTKNDAADRNLLKGHSIKFIVNCAAELDCHFPESFKYCHLAIRDPDDSFQSRLANTLSFINDARQQGNVLVHCSGAVSRSPAVVLAYLVNSGHSLENAAMAIRRSVCTRPNIVFLRQIVDHFHLTVSDAELASLVDQLGSPVI